MNRGEPPTDFQDRTGLLTPPGILFRARERSFVDLLAAIGDFFTSATVIKFNGGSNKKIFS
jgi:hypothetical protein